MSKLQVPTNGSIASKVVTFAIDADLMHNQAPATVVDPQHAMSVVSDQQGNPMLFSIGNDGVLYVVMRDAKSTSGWKQYDLSSALGAGLRVTTFAVSQALDHRILLAAAVAPAATPAQTTLYLTPPITPDATLTKWNEIGKQWVARPFTGGAAEITKILIGAGDAQGTQLGIAGVQQGGANELWRINTDATDTTWLWQPFPLPENASGPITDLAVGTVFGDWGVYALYPTSTGQTLEFTTLPDPQFHKVSRYEFALPAPATSIAALPGAGNSHDLYFAGDGIYLYAASGSKVTTIASATAIKSIQHLLVRQDGDTAAVYAITGDQALSYCGGPRAKAGQWSPPVPIRQQVTQLTAMRSPTRFSNELFIVKANSSLVYLYQDPVKSLWNENPIELASLNKIVAFTTYTAHIDVQGDNGGTLYGQTFALTASSWVYATINGYAYSIDAGHPVSVTPDLQNTITIIIPTETIAAPVLHLSADFLTQVVDIIPTTNVHAGLEKIQKGSDLGTAKLKNGANLLTKTVDDKTLESSAQAVKQLTQIITSPPQAQPRALAGLARNAAAMPAMSLNASAQGQVWGMRFDGGAAQHFDGSAATAHFNTLWNLTAQPAGAAAVAAPASLTAALLDPGSALEWLWDEIKEIGSFLVEAFEGALNFVFQIGKELFRFVIDCAEAAYRLVHWVLLKTLDIDLDKFVQWLGFIFDWDDIKRVHTMLVGLMNQSLDYGRNQLDGFKGEVTKWFEGMKEKAKALQPDTDTRTVFARANGLQGDQPADADTLQRVMSSPGGNWGNYHMTHSGAMTGPAAPAADVSDPFTAFMNDVLVPTLNSVSQTAQQLGTDFDALFHDQSLTTGQAMQKIVADLALGLLDAAEKIVTGLIQFVEDLITLLKKGLNAPLDIPFFSAFYKSISGNDLTILDAIMLVLAIPTTIIYKIVANKSPELDAGTVIFPGATNVTPNAAHPVRPLMAAVAGPGALRDAGGPEDPGGEKDKLTPGEKAYQHWGGLCGLLAQGASDAIGILQAVALGNADVAESIDEADELREQAEKYAPWRTGIDLAKLVGIFPLGYDPEVPLQRAVWFFELASPFIELAIDRCVKAALKRMAKGIWLIIDGIVVMVLEAIVFGFEMTNAKNEEKATDGFKLAQNILYFVGKGSNGVLCLVPRNSTASAYALAGAIGGVALGSIFNGVRLLMAVSGDLEYQRY